MSSHFLLAAAAAFLAAAAVYLRLCVRRRPPFPTDWPLAGMLPGLLASFHNLHEWCTGLLAASTDRNFVYRGPALTGMDYLLTGDPENVRHVFVTNFSNYPKGPDFVDIFDIAGAGIFNVDGEAWRSQRAKAQLLFGRPRFAAFVGRTTKHKLEKGLLPLLSHYAGEGFVDLQEVFMRLTFDTTMSAVFGVDPGRLSVGTPPMPFAQAIDVVLDTILFRHVVPVPWWKLLRKLNVGQEKKCAAARQVVAEFIAGMIAAKKANSTINDDADLLSSYIHAGAGEDDDDGKLLHDTTVNFLTAGRDTVAAGLSWTIFLLSQHPGATAKLLDELKTVAPAGSSTGDMTVFDPDDLSKLVYLNGVVSEALRLYPPVPFQHKMAVAADTLPSGHALRPGAKIIVSFYSMGRMASIWGEDCRRFMPERWIADDGGMRYEPSHRFIAFNTGPRTCLGKHMAMTQLKAAAAAVTWNFAVEVPAARAVEPKLSVILHMKNGLLVKLKKRQAPPN